MHLNLSTSIPNKYWLINYNAFSQQTTTCWSYRQSPLVWHLSCNLLSCNTTFACQYRNRRERAGTKLNWLCLPWITVKQFVTVAVLNSDPFIQQHQAKNQKSSLLSCEVLLDISNTNWSDSNKGDFHIILLLLFRIAYFLNAHL